MVVGHFCLLSVFFFNVLLGLLALIYIVERYFAFSKRFGLGVARNINVSAGLFQVGSKKPSRLHKSCADKRNVLYSNHCKTGCYKGLCSSENVEEVLNSKQLASVCSYQNEFAPSQHVVVAVLLLRPWRLCGLLRPWRLCGTLRTC